MIRRSAVIALSGLGVAVGCSGRSIVIGGDPNEEPPGMVATGGVFGSGGAPTGGAFPTGGSNGGGVFPTGGSNGGGVFPTGGTPITGGTGYGGTGAQGGASGSGFAVGGGGNVEPYPRVAWEMGQGYRSACPRWGDTWGFTCWHHTEANESESCTLDGSVFCNACSCAVPCETSADCPTTIAGDEAACLAAPTNVPSCFVLCYPSTPRLCPDDMTCSRHPGTGDFVCVWVSDAVE